MKTPPSQELIVDPQTNLEKLGMLLEIGHEFNKLDYKQTIDLRQTSAKIELARDMGAMQLDGGYLVVGADDAGKPSGIFLPEHLALFDEAKLRQMVLRYLPSLGDIRVAIHEYEGNPYAIVVVLPNPDVLAVFACDGTYKDKVKNLDVIKFRQGDVFVRHGSSSERWTQPDVARIIDRLCEREKEKWRKAWSSDFQSMLESARAQSVSQGPARAFDWNLDETTFENVLLELVRTNDRLPIELFFENMPRQLRKLEGAGQIADLKTFLDRWSLILSIAIRLKKRKLLDGTLKAILISYPTAGPIGHLEIAIRILALGALAVRALNWKGVSALAGMMCPVDKGRHPIHHAQNQAVWKNLVPALEHTPGWAAIPIIQMASQLTEQKTWLNPEREATDEQILESLCQFDVLALLKITGDGPGAYIPNFAGYFRQRTEPVLALLLSDAKLRKEIFPYDDAALAAKLREVNTLANKFSARRNGWEGYHYHEPSIDQLLSRYAE